MVSSSASSHIRILELIEHIPCVPWCIASATDGQFNPGEMEHVQDNLVQACAVVSIGVSDIHVGVAMMGNKKTLFVTLVDRIPRFETLKQVFRLIHCAYELLRCLDLEIWWFLCWRQTDKPIALPLLHMRAHGVKVLRDVYHMNQVFLQYFNWVQDFNYNAFPISVAWSSLWLSTHRRAN